MVLAAGYLPGAVLPSTLAALAGLEEDRERPVLVVNAGPSDGDDGDCEGRDAAAASVGGYECECVPSGVTTVVPLVDRESTAQEWAQQEALGRVDGRFDARLRCRLRWWRRRWCGRLERGLLRREVAQAVSVAAAYFEDTLQRSPEQVLVGGNAGRGVAGARCWTRAELEGLRVREMVEAGMLEAGRGDGERAAGLAGGCAGSAEELMRISVNLATRPFVELRPLFARLRLAMGVLAVLAVGLGFALHSLNAKARVAQAQMDALKAKTTAVPEGAAGE